MDEDDSQPAQSQPIDVIQLLQSIQSGAAIPCKTQALISTPNNDNNNNKVVQQTEGNEMKLCDSLTYFSSRWIREDQVLDPAWQLSPLHFLSDLQLISFPLVHVHSGHNHHVPELTGLHLFGFR